jgi:UDP-N-acetylmuramoyl-tripeptide--D-alanyl-D-alanine ligase
MLAEMLPTGGKLFVNGDQPWTAELQGRSRASVVKIGFSSRNDWCATVTRMDLQGIEFRVEAPLLAYAGDYRLPLVGRHQALNALFALAVGAELGLSRFDIQAGLAAVQAPSMRLQLWDWNGAQVLDDAYNANADSMLAALQTLKELPCKGRRLAVLGDMAELGAHGEAAHAEVGRHVAELGIGQLFAVGAMAKVMGRAARAAGLNRVLEFHEVQSATAAVKAFLRPGDLLLLKASRAVRLEQISDALKKS